MIKVKEAFKSLIIICLLISILFMSARLVTLDLSGSGTGIIDTSPSSLLSSIGLGFVAKLMDGGAQGAHSAYPAERIIYPTSVAVRLEGGFTAAFNNKSAGIEAFSRISDIFIAALADGEYVMPESEFSELVKKNGILIDLGRTLSLDLFSRILTESGASVSGVRFRLCFIENISDTLWLHIKDEAGARTVSFSTADEGALSEFIDFCAFAAKSDEYISVIPSESLSELQPGIAAEAGYFYPEEIFVAKPLYSIITFDDSGVLHSALLGDVLKRFGFNYSSLNRATDKEGNVTYVENISSITISPNGRLTFSALQQNGGVSLSALVGAPGETGYTQRDVIVAAQKFIDGFGASVGGEAAELRLKTAYYDEDNTFTVEYEYVSNGLPLKFSDGIGGAVFKYYGGFFSRIQIDLKSYSFAQQPYSVESVTVGLKLFGRGTLRRAELAFYDDGGRTLYPQYLYYFID